MTRKSILYGISLYLLFSVLFVLLKVQYTYACLTNNEHQKQIEQVIADFSSSDFFKSPGLKVLYLGIDPNGKEFFYVHGETLESIHQIPTVFKEIPVKHNYSGTIDETQLKNVSKRNLIYILDSALAIDARKRLSSLGFAVESGCGRFIKANVPEATITNLLGAQIMTPETLKALENSITTAEKYFTFNFFDPPATENISPLEGLPWNAFGPSGEPQFKKGKK